MDRQKEFTHGGDDGDHARFMPLVDHVMVAFADGGFSSDGDEGRHVEGGADIPVSCFGYIAVSI